MRNFVLLILVVGAVVAALMHNNDAAGTMTLFAVLVWLLT